MNKAEVLALHDRELRIEDVEQGARREQTPDVIRYYNPSSRMAWITYAWLNEANIGRVIEEQIAHFEREGMSFEWKVYDHDWPPDLTDRLAARGFQIEEPEALVVLDLQEASPDLFTTVGHEVRLLQPEDLADVSRLKERVYGERSDWIQDELGESMRNSPNDFLVYGAYVDGIMAAAAWIRFHPGTHFASLWGGSTLPEYRRRGIYHDLVAVRAQQADRRGFRYLTLDASSMSRPILEKLGFQVLVYSHPCIWTVEKK